MGFGKEEEEEERRGKDACRDLAAMLLFNSRLE